MKRFRSQRWRQQCKDIPDSDVYALLADPAKPSVGWTLVSYGFHPMVVYKKLERIDARLTRLGWGLEVGTSLMTPWLSHRPLCRATIR